MSRRMDDQVAAGEIIKLSEAVWLQAMHPSRTALSERQGKNPTQSYEWTSPVIYVDRGGLKLRAQPTTRDSLRLPDVAAPVGDVPDLLPETVRLRNRLQKLQSYRLQFANAGVPQPALDSLDLQIRSTEIQLLSADLAALRNAFSHLMSGDEIKLAHEIARQIKIQELRLGVLEASANDISTAGDSLTT
jgi:hypothetical protein